MDRSEYSSEVAHLVKFTMVEPSQHTPGGTLHVLHGDEMGLGDLSLLLSYNPPGGGPTLHRHTYIETFVVQEGRGLYTGGEEVFEAEVGDVVVVPSNVPHLFRATDGGSLTHLAIHQANHSISIRD